MKSVDTTSVSALAGNALTASDDAAASISQNQNISQSRLDTMTAVVKVAKSVADSVLAQSRASYGPPLPVLVNKGAEASESASASARFKSLLVFILGEFASWNAKTASQSPLEQFGIVALSSEAAAIAEVLAGDNGVMGLQHALDTLITINTNLNAVDSASLPHGDLPTPGITPVDATILKLLVKICGKLGIDPSV